MRANRSRNTGPELQLRRRLHAAGLRFRLDVALPFDRRRRADIVLTKVGLYVFVDGCFWHGCPEHFVEPRTRRSFWIDKISANRRRDADTTQRLTDLGHVVVRVWEHEDSAAAADRIARIYHELRNPK